MLMLVREYYHGASRESLICFVKLGIHLLAARRKAGRKLEEQGLVVRGLVVPSRVFATRIEYE